MSVDFLDLSIHELTRNFGRRRALSRVSIECRAGEVVGLLGPNGSGKSTLLAIVATLARPYSGHVRYGPRTADDIGPPLRSRIGVLSHDLHLYSELTARENLAFFGRLYGLSSADAMADRALERAGLSDRGGDAVSSFSRGMRQRLALERALLHSPRLLLLDEPFTGLDDASTLALIKRLGELRANGCITLLATHDFELAERVVNRAVILQDGKLLSTEPDVRDLRRRYQTRLASEAGR